MKKYVQIASFVMITCSIGMAFGQPDFGTLVTFGDSLTHNDPLGFAYGNPQDLYGEDPAEAVFSKGSGDDDSLGNYAVAGSKAEDIEDQIDLYDWWQEIGMQDAATLINFEIGGNDIMDNVDDLAAHPPGEDGATDEITSSILATMKENMLRLYYDHTGAQFIVWTIPDVTLTPEYWGELSQAEINNIRAHTQVINDFIRGLDRHSFVIVLDLYGIFHKMVAHPPSDGTHTLAPPPEHEDYDDMFADEIHPTAVSNAILANSIIREINRKWGGTVPSYTIPELLDLADVSE